MDRSHAVLDATRPEKRYGRYDSPLKRKASHCSYKRYVLPNPHNDGGVV
jgi:hypothetical protein